MLTILVGTDYEKLRGRLTAIVGDRATQQFTPETFDQSTIAQLAAGGDLFQEEQVIVLKDTLTDTSCKQFIHDRLDLIVSSTNQFIITEEKLLKKDQKPYTKLDVTIETFDLPKKGKNEGFNIFAISDQLGARDKKRLWITYQQAIRENTTPEEIHGIMWWQVKNMLAVMKQGSNPGLHPFVFGKTERAIKKYKKEELIQLGHRLIESFHMARRGQADLGREVEKIVLTL